MKSGSHHQGHRSIFLSKGTGSAWQMPIGRGCGRSGVDPLQIFIRTPSDYKKIQLLNFKILSILDCIGSLLYNIIHYQNKWGAAAPPPVPLTPVCLIIFTFHMPKMS